MFEVKAEITKFIDYDFVECHFIDAHGIERTFHEKIPVITTERLEEDSSLPRDAFIGCQIIEERYVEGRKFIKIDTEKPWGIESTNGETCFEVSPEQLVES